jgi:hypothetical protein
MKASQQPFDSTAAIWGQAHNWQSADRGVLHPNTLTGSGFGLAVAVGAHVQIGSAVVLQRHQRRRHALQHLFVLVHELTCIPSIGASQRGSAHPNRSLEQPDGTCTCAACERVSLACL